MLVLQCIVVHVHSESELWALLPNLKKKKKKNSIPSTVCGQLKH